MLNILAWVAGILLMLVALGIPVTIAAIILTRDTGDHASGYRPFRDDEPRRAPLTVIPPCMELGSYATAAPPTPPAWRGPDARAHALARGGFVAAVFAGQRQAIRDWAWDLSHLEDDQFADSTGTFAAICGVK